MIAINLARGMNKELERQRVRAWKIAHPERTYAATKRSWRERNPEAAERARQAWERRNPTYERDRIMLKKYGITAARFAEMVATQQNRCAICDGEFTDSHGRHVDHDHATGKVRAILCRMCNSGLGMLRESERVLLRAIAYLKEHK